MRHSACAGATTLSNVNGLALAKLDNRGALIN
jgi:hypothetical protein